MKDRFILCLACSAALHAAVLAVIPISPPRVEWRSSRAGISVAFRKTTTTGKTTTSQRTFSAAPSPSGFESVAPDSVSRAPAAGEAAQIVDRAPDAEPAATDAAGLLALTDSPPVPFSRNLPPRYPWSARCARRQGTVLLDVDVAADGAVTGMKIAVSSGYADLDREAVRALRQWRFAPAALRGVAIASRVRVPVRFTLSR